jgi:hypothetical protein
MDKDFKVIIIGAGMLLSQTRFTVVSKLCFISIGTDSVIHNQAFLALP